MNTPAQALRGTSEWVIIKSSERVRPVPRQDVSVHAGRPRPGKRFEPVHELELAEDARLAARTLPGAFRGVRILLETAGPFGVPDLLAVVGPLSQLEERLTLAVPPLLNQVDAGVVAVAAPSAPLTAATLARRVGWPLEAVTRRLPYLLRSGALLRASTTTYVRPAELRPVGRLYAIETKVRDWKKAVRQARTYSTWCDGYVIVMPALSADSLANLEEAVASDCGGLMLGGEWVRRPRVTRRSLAQRLWGSEHAIAAFYS